MHMSYEIAYKFLIESISMNYILTTKFAAKLTHRIS